MDWRTNLSTGLATHLYNCAKNLRVHLTRVVSSRKCTVHVGSDELKTPEQHE